MSACVGLNIHKGKSKVLKVNAASASPFILEGEALEEVEEFTNLGSTVNKQGGADAHVRVRTGKAISKQRTVGVNETRTRMDRMDRTYFTQTSLKHHKTITQVEPAMKKKERATSKHLAPRWGGRCQEDGLHLGTAGEVGSGSECLEMAYAPVEVIGVSK